MFLQWKGGWELGSQRFYSDVSYAVVKRLWEWFTLSSWHSSNMRRRGNRSLVWRRHILETVCSVEQVWGLEVSTIPAEWRCRYRSWSTCWLGWSLARCCTSEMKVGYIPSGRPGNMYPANICINGWRLNMKPVIAYWAPTINVRITVKIVAMMNPHQGRVDFITYKHTMPVIQQATVTPKYHESGTSL